MFTVPINILHGCLLLRSNTCHKKSPFLVDVEAESLKYAKDHNDDVYAEHAAVHARLEAYLRPYLRPTLMRTRFCFTVSDLPARDFFVSTLRASSFSVEELRKP
jgi:hypothetical protein